MIPLEMEHVCSLPSEKMSLYKIVPKEGKVMNLVLVKDLKQAWNESVPKGNKLTVKSVTTSKIVIAITPRIKKKYRDNYLDSVMRICSYGA